MNKNQPTPPLEIHDLTVAYQDAFDRTLIVASSPDGSRRRLRYPCELRKS